MEETYIEFLSYRSNSISGLSSCWHELATWPYD
jgi:hypothetical protein